MHSLTQNGVTKWVALSEGAGGGVGWLTVRRKQPVARLNTYSDATLCLCPQTNERKEVRCSLSTTAMHRIYHSTQYSRTALPMDKTCSQCKITKPLENFYIGAKLLSTSTLLALRHLWPLSWNDTPP